MHRLVELAARHVPGCSGATAVLWHEDEATITAASHPDLSELAEVQLAWRRGPIIEAVAEGKQISCPDTLSEERWPEYTSRALSMGVRSSLTLVHVGGRLALSMTMYATRPKVLDASRAPVGQLLIAFGSAVMRNTSTYDAAQRTVRQLNEGADSRAVVDQAKGILMVGLSCSADDALRRMREISPRSPRSPGGSSNRTSLTSADVRLAAECTGSDCQPYLRCPRTQVRGRGDNRRLGLKDDEPPSRRVARRAGSRMDDGT